MTVLFYSGGYKKCTCDSNSDNQKLLKYDLQLLV